LAGGELHATESAEYTEGHGITTAKQEQQQQEQQQQEQQQQEQQQQEQQEQQDRVGVRRSDFTRRVLQRRFNQFSSSFSSFRGVPRIPWIPWQPSTTYVRHRRQTQPSRNFPRVWRYG
jgi:hypothetical protein